MADETSGWKLLDESPAPPPGVSGQSVPSWTILPETPPPRAAPASDSGWKLLPDQPTGPPQQGLPASAYARNPSPQELSEAQRSADEDAAFANNQPPQNVGLPGGAASLPGGYLPGVPGPQLPPQLGGAPPTLGPLAKAELLVKLGQMALKTSPIPGIPITPADKTTPQQVPIPGVGTVSLTPFTKTILNTITRQATPENLGLMLAGQVGSELLQAAVNSGPVVNALKGAAPIVQQSIDKAAAGAIPGTFGFIQAVGAGKAGAEAKRLYDESEAARKAGDQGTADAKLDQSKNAAVAAATNVVMGALSFMGARGAAKEAGSAYAPKPQVPAYRDPYTGEQVPGETIGAAPVPMSQQPGRPKPVSPAEAAQTAAQLEASGRNLAAQSWRSADPRQPLPIVVDGQTMLLHPAESTVVPNAQPVANPEEPWNPPVQVANPKRAVAVRVTDPQGNNVITLTPQGMLGWLREKNVIGEVPGKLPGLFGTPSQGLSPEAEESIESLREPPQQFIRSAQGPVPIPASWKAPAPEAIVQPAPEQPAAPPPATATAMQPPQEGEAFTLQQPFQFQRGGKVEVLPAGNYKVTGVNGTAIYIQGQDQDGKPVKSRLKIGEYQSISGKEQNAPVTPVTPEATPSPTPETSGVAAAPVAAAPVAGTPVVAPAPQAASETVPPSPAPVAAPTPPAPAPTPPAGFEAAAPPQTPESTPEQPPATGTAVTGAAATPEAPAAEVSPAGVHITPGLEPWHLGEIEGQPTRQVLDRINALITTRPDEPVPGRGGLSTQDGEAFNSFKQRALGELQTHMDALDAQPSQKIGLVTHYRDIKLIESWVKNGTPKDFSLDHPTMTGKGDEPASVQRLYRDDDGEWRLQKVSMASDKPLDGGIYLIRHGKTAWNGETTQGQSGEDIIRGSSNIDLAPEGYAQAQERAQQFKQKGGLDQIFSSPLTRARETAEAIAKTGLTGQPAPEEPLVQPPSVEPEEANATPEEADTARATPGAKPAPEQAPATGTAVTGAAATPEVSPAPKPSQIAIKGDTYPVRALIGRQVKGVKWNKEQKYWEAPDTPENRKAIQEIIKGLPRKNKGITIESLGGPVTPQPPTHATTPEQASHVIQDVADGIDEAIAAARDSREEQSRKYLEEFTRDATPYLTGQRFTHASTQSRGALQAALDRAKDFLAEWGRRGEAPTGEAWDNQVEQEQEGRRRIYDSQIDALRNGVQRLGGLVSSGHVIDPSDESFKRLRDAVAGAEEILEKIPAPIGSNLGTALHANAQIARGVMADAAKTNPAALGNYLDSLPPKLRPFARTYSGSLMGEHFEPSFLSAHTQELPEMYRRRIKELVEFRDLWAPQTPAQSAATAPSTQHPTPAPQTGPEALADAVYQKLKAGESLGKIGDFNRLAEQFLGDRTSGQWTPKDGFEAMEAGMNKLILENAAKWNALPYEQALAELRKLLSLMTSQMTRTDEQLKLQQFSTPPTEAFTAIKAANIKPTDVMWEPSAGNGGIASFAKGIGAEVVVNEPDAMRARMLKHLGFGDPTALDGEVIAATMPRSVDRPTVVVMNPPFSSGGLKSHEARNKNQYGFNHVDSALQALLPNGRLVAILGGGRADDLDGGASLRTGPSGKFFERIAQMYNVRANIRINGKEYQKYGTSFATRIIVIDKTGPTPSQTQPGKKNWDSTVNAHVDTLDEAYNLLRGVADDRPAITAQPTGEARPGAGVSESGQGATGSHGNAGPGGLPGSGGRSVSGNGQPQGPGPVSGLPGGQRPAGTPEAPSVHQPGIEPQGHPAPAGAEGVAGHPGNVPVGLPGERPPVTSPQDIIDRIRKGLQQSRPPAATETAPTLAPEAAPAPAPPARAPRTRSHTAGTALKKAGLTPSETPAPAPANPFKEAADAALQAMRDKYAKRVDISGYAPTDIQMQPSKIDADDLVQVGLKGAELMYDGVTNWEDWQHQFMTQAGDVVRAMAEAVGEPLDAVLHQIHYYAAAAVEPLGVEVTAPPAPQALEGNENADEAEQDSAGYVKYTPKVKGPGHPGDIVETQAMATVPTPPFTIKLNLPPEAFTDGRLSAVQLEAIAMGAQMNEVLLPGGARAAALCGDGTGVGKGRIAAGYLLHNWNSGRTRLVFVTEKVPLMQDITRDLIGIKANQLTHNIQRKGEKFIFPKGSPIRTLGDWKAAQEVKHEGILFVTYSLLRSHDSKNNQRDEQLRKYLAGDDNGEGAAIVFDEAHNLKNAVASGRSPASLQGTKARALMAAVPGLRSFSLTATAATDVVNLGYMDRLGLWGPGTAFPGGFTQFVTAVGNSGMSAMELIAMELKAQGKYCSRTLSYRGVTYDETKHELNADQKAIYRTAAEAWTTAYDLMGNAIRNLTNGGAKQKANAMIQFYAAQLRFFGILLTALKTPTAVRLANEAYARGESVVISLVNTNEAQQKREENKRAAAEDDDEEQIIEYDFGPAGILKEMIQEHFPTAQWADDVDSEGNPIKVPVMTIDDHGNPIQATNPEAERIRDEFIARIERDLHLPDNPLDILINSLGGPSKVAELTGRGKRFDSDTQKFVPRGDPNVSRKDLNIVEAANFQNGKKRTAIISGAANTGITLSADKSAKNQQKRLMIILQPGWQADKVIQGMGRVHRSNEAHTPGYQMVYSDLGGETRFVSTIARRIGSLGALTKGQKTSLGGVDLMEKVNFETAQGRAATNAFYEAMLRNRPVPGTEEWDDALPEAEQRTPHPEGSRFKQTDSNGGESYIYGTTLEPTQQYTGYGDETQPYVRVKWDNGTQGRRVREGIIFTGERHQTGEPMGGKSILSQLHLLRGQAGQGETVPPRDRQNVTKLLNRLMALDPDIQNPVYNYFYDIFTAAVQRAVEDGTLDVGVKVMPGDEFNLKESRVISTDPKTGAKTFYYPIAAQVRTNRVSPKELDNRMRQFAKQNPRILRDNDGGLILAIDAKPIVHEDGRVEPASRISRPVNGNWRRLPNTQVHATELNEWAEETADAAAATVERLTDRIASDQESLDRWGGAYYSERIEKAKTELAEAQNNLADAQSILADPDAWSHEEWENQYSTAPSHITTEHHLIGGAVLRWWNAIHDVAQSPEIYTAVDEASKRRIVGVEIPAASINQLLARITGSRTTVNANQLNYDVMRNGLQYRLETGVQVRRGRVAGRPVLQLMTADDNVARNLVRLGVLHERGVQPIYYVPNDPATARDAPLAQQNIVDRVVEAYPILPDEAPPEVSGYRPTEGFYSQLQRTIEAKMPSKAPAAQIIGIVKNPQNGVKADELKWSGLEPWLMKQGNVSKQQVLDYLKANEVQVEEVAKGKSSPAPNPARIAALESELASAVEAARQADAAAAATAEVKEGDRVATVGSAGSRGGYNYSTGKIYEARRRASDGQLLWKLVESFGGTRAGRSERFIGELKAEAARRGLRWTGHAANNEWAVEAGTDAAKEAEAARLHAEVKKLEIRLAHAKEPTGRSLEGGNPMFADWQLPGGKNYRELLLTLPAKTSEPVTWGEPEGKTYNLRMHGLGEREFVQEWTASDGATIRTDPKRGFVVDCPLVQNASQPTLEAAKQFYQEQKNKAELTYGNRREMAGNYTSPHWDEPNVLAHIRFNDRTDTDGKRDLHVEEIQSDWHQAGKRQGYKDQLPEGYFVVPVKEGERGYDNGWRFRIVNREGRLHSDRSYGATAEQAIGNADFAARVPAAPFSKTWHELAFRRMLRWAAENGYDRMTWTTGEQQAERYDLSKHVSRVEYDPEQKRLSAYGLHNEDIRLPYKAIAPEDIPDYIGKDAAKQLLESPMHKRAGEEITGKPAVHVLHTKDLKIGGEGMKGFYDQILPEYAARYGKKWGAKVGTAPIVASKAGNDWRYSWVNNYGISLRGGRTPEEAGEMPVANGPWHLQDNAAPVHYIDITPEMKKSVMEGQPLFNIPAPQPPIAPTTVTAPRLASEASRTGAYRPGKSLAYHLDRAVFEPIPLSPADSTYASAFVVNQDAMAVVGSLTGQSADDCAMNLRGAHLDPHNASKIASLLAGMKQPYTTVPPAMEELHQIAARAGAENKSLILVADHETFPEWHKTIALREELDHALQAGSTQTVTRHHLGASATWLTQGSDAGRTAAATITKRYGYLPEGNLAAEVSVRLMRPGGYQELGINAIEARYLAAQYVKALRREYGTEQSRAIAERVFAAAEPRGAAGRGGPGEVRGGAGQAVSAQPAGEPGPGRQWDLAARHQGAGGATGTAVTGAAATEDEALLRPRAELDANLRRERTRNAPQGRPGHRFGGKEVGGNGVEETGLLAARKQPSPALQQFMNKTGSHFIWDKAKGKWVNQEDPEEVWMGDKIEVPSQPRPGSLKAEMSQASAALRAVKDDLLKLLAPAAREGAKPAALSVRHRAAELARVQVQIEKALEAAGKALNRLPVDERWDFYDRIERGAPEPDPMLAGIAQTFRQVLDASRKDVQDLGTGKLENFIVNYLPHIYKNPTKAEQVFAEYYAKRPMEGPKHFLKRRKFETLRDAMEAGLEPISNDPVELILAKVQEMQRYVMAHRVLHDGIDNGWVKYFRAGTPKDPGFAWINDKIATVFGPQYGAVKLPSGENAEPVVFHYGPGAAEGEMEPGEAEIAGTRLSPLTPDQVRVYGTRIMGQYAAPEAGAMVINNYLSPGLRRFAAYRGYVGMANSMNQFQLGFSAFHLGFTTMDAAISKFALGVYQASHGHPLQGAASITQTLIAPATGIVKGNKMMREYEKQGAVGGEIGKLVDAMILAGGRGHMETFYKTAITKHMLRSIREMSPTRRAMGALGGAAAGGLIAGPAGAGVGFGLGLAGALRAPFALAEQVSRPILEWAVPRQKMAVFADLAQFELQRALENDWTPQQTQDALAKAWDSVDNRMGQLVYDNLFWNKVFKDLVMGSIRSVGWNTGTVREVAGGIGDIRKMLRAPWGAGSGPDMTTRLSYLIGLLLVPALLGAVVHYLYHGTAPEHLIDYYAPKDSHGQRIWLPTYMRDIIAVRMKGPYSVAVSKIHPFLTAMTEMLGNEDYWHRPIIHWDAPTNKVLDDLRKEVLKQYTPMAVRKPAGKAAAAQGEEKVLPFIGVTRAPAYVSGDQQKHRGRY